MPVVPPHRRRTLVALAAAALTVTGIAIPSPGQASVRSAADDDERPLKSLVDQPITGDVALDVFEGRVDDLAARNGLPTEELAEVLGEDATSRIDQDARLFHVDPMPEEVTEQSASSLSARALATDVFALHSLPGAARVIYLDFNGHTLTNTAWNPRSTVQITPYDTDGNPGVFSAAEQAVVQETWQRVADDYAPFGVDVTTQDPGTAAINRSSSSDQVYGTRVVVDPTGWYYGPRCTCGGVAYVGVFDSANNGYNLPAWVFTRGVGNGAKNIAEAASHEAGHNLGLSHDGTSSTGYYTGHGAWAPIMGVGYSRAITQWSRGEYAGANNTQDDYVVMGQNGIGVRATDHGTTPATATAISLGQAVTGVSAAQTDVDHFRITVPAGVRTFTANPAAVGANLDISLSVLNSAGAVLATWNPASAQVNAGTATGLAASGSLDLTAGTYYVRVDDTGSGNPLDTGYSTYGSHGTFSLLVS